MTELGSGKARIQRAVKKRPKRMVRHDRFTLEKGRKLGTYKSIHYPSNITIQRNTFCYKIN